MKITKLEPIITTTKKGKEIKRYNVQIQKGTGNNVPNINVGITPGGTRYYRALLPDKSWGSTFLRAKDGTETIIDSCRAPYGVKSIMERRKEKLILEDKLIEHHKDDRMGTHNYVWENGRAGQSSKAFVQDEIYRYMHELKQNTDFDSFKPIKRTSPFIKFLKSLF